MAQSPYQRIFVVDDDEDDQFLLRQVLQQHTPTASVEVLADGEVLLTALAQAQSLPHLVLLDLNMPRMGGLEALKHIRANQDYDQLPIVILTTSDSFADQAQAKALHATDYLIKPGTNEQLNRLIQTVKKQWV